LIMEVLRISSVIPIGVAHLCTEDTKFHGFDIPKGSMISANIYAAHHDPEVWGDPEVFRPERFLAPDGTCIQRHESFFPFSTGRRVCMGENLARDSLFLFITMIGLNFSVHAPLGQEKPKLEPKYGQITHQPKTFEVSMKYRG